MPKQCIRNINFIIYTLNVLVDVQKSILHTNLISEEKKNNKL